MPSARIILLCIAAAVLYGLVHDQFTARLCVEYFSIAHPHVLNTDSPGLLALYWGIAATWWVGVILGIPLAVACRAGPSPKLPPGQLVRPIGRLLLCMAACAIISGMTGYWLVASGRTSIGDWADVIPAPAHARFFADLCSHLASYAAGFIGGIIVIIWAARHRRRMRVG